jgi:hypothetical protein
VSPTALFGCLPDGPLSDIIGTTLAINFRLADQSEDDPASWPGQIRRLVRRYYIARALIGLALNTVEPYANQPMKLLPVLAAPLLPEWVAAFSSGLSYTIHIMAGIYPLGDSGAASAALLIPVLRPHRQPQDSQSHILRADH